MPAKDERLEARITEAQKALFQRAAAIQGITLTDFVVTSLQERAAEVVKDHDVMVLSAEDREVFVEALLNPPKPNEALRKAAQKHRQILG